MTTDVVAERRKALINDFRNKAHEDVESKQIAEKMLIEYEEGLDDAKQYLTGDNPQPLAILVKQHRDRLPSHLFDHQTRELLIESYTTGLVDGKSKVYCLSFTQKELDKIVTDFFIPHSR
jgi:hypothetical protein